jgi:hypothetical protein
VLVARRIIRNIVVSEKLDIKERVLFSINKSSNLSLINMVVILGNQ